MNMSKLKARMLDKWQTLTLNEVMDLVKKFMIAAVLCTLGWLYFMNKGEDAKPVDKPEENNIILSDEALNRDLDARIAAAVQGELDAYFAKVAEQITPPDQTLSGAIEAPQEDSLPDENALDFGDPIDETQNPGVTDSEFANGENAESYTPVFEDFGGIDTFHNPEAAADSEQKNTEVTASYKIPPGFMPAKLLVGIRAQTSNDGETNPKPIHFRVQAPATLPNKVRMNLAGCFVIANTWGNLATERIEGELKSLHCISKDRNTLIEGDIMGYIADTDGQRDMHGRVVTKAGSLLARQVAADVLGGIGDVAANSAGTTQTSPLGTVKTLNTEEMWQAGLSSGASSGFKRTSEFLASLIVQSGPIIESGAAKDVMLMIQKTSEIKIIELNMGALN